MADTPHSSLTGAELHDVRDANGTSAGSILTTNGTGSLWVPPEQAFRTVVGISHLFNSSSVQAITVAGDPTLHDPNDYDLIEGFTTVFADGVTVEANGTMTTQLAGIYTFTFFISLTVDSGNTLIGINGILNGVSTAATSPVMKVYNKEVSTIFTLSGSAIGSFAIGDNIGLGIACDDSVNVTVIEGSLTTQRVGNL